MNDLNKTHEEINEKNYVKYVIRSLSDFVSKKIFSTLFMGGMKNTQHNIDIRDYEEEIRDNITQIKLKNRELGEQFEAALNSILRAISLNKINIGSDMVDGITFLNPIISGLSSLSIVPSALHKYGWLNKNLSSLQESLESHGILEYTIHKPGYLDTILEGIDFLIEVVLKFALQAVPAPAKALVPVTEILVSLGTAKTLYNALIQVRNSSYAVLKKESS